MFDASQCVEENSRKKQSDGKENAVNITIGIVINSVNNSYCQNHDHYCNYDYRDEDRVILFIFIEIFLIIIKLGTITVDKLWYLPYDNL